MRRFVVALMISSVAYGCEWDYTIWIPRSPSADPLFRFVKGKKAGYIDQTGKVVIRPSLPVYGNGGGEFYDGLQEIGAGDGIYADTSGKTVIDRHWLFGWHFSDGLAAVMEPEKRKWGYIDRTGEIVISPRFDSSPRNGVWSFENGFARIEVAGKYGYIDRSGEFAISPRFVYGASFHGGMVRVVAEGPCQYSIEGPCGLEVVVPRRTTEGPVPACKLTFADASGQVLAQHFDEAGDFAEGLAPVRIGTLWGYIDMSGRTVVEPRFDRAEPFSEGLARVTEKGLFGFLDHSGVYVIRPQFVHAEGFSDGRALVQGTDKTWFYIGKDGRRAFPDKFEVASSFFKGLAHVKLDDGSFAYINPKGRRVFTYKP